MNRLILILLVIILSVLSMSYSNYEYPDWIPKDTVEAAKRLWEQRVNDGTIEWLNNYVGIDSREIAYTAIFKYPHILVDVDYEKYEESSNICEYFTPLDNKYDKAYGFEIFIKNINVGRLMICKVNDEWIYYGLEYGRDETVDVLGPIYNRYDTSLGYKMYCDENTNAMFVVKDESVKAIFTYNSKEKRQNQQDNIEYMKNQKRCIIEWKKKNRLLPPS